MLPSGSGMLMDHLAVHATWVYGSLVRAGDANEPRPGRGEEREPGRSGSLSKRKLIRVG